MPEFHKYSGYAPTEERINVLSHGFGLVLSVAALLALVTKASTTLQMISVSVFALSMISLYASSTIYHSTTDAALRSNMRTVDHAMIYVLIAGSYTPFSLLVLGGTIGWSVFATSWIMAAVGVTLKLFYTGRYDKLSTVMYVFMGWLIVIAAKPLLANMSAEGLGWLFGGGIAYTMGAVFYSLKNFPFGHATFHIFVLAGSACHFISVYYYVI